MFFRFKKAEKTELQERESCPECGNSIPLSASGQQNAGSPRCPCTALNDFIAAGAAFPFTSATPQGELPTRVTLPIETPTIEATCGESTESESKDGESISGESAIGQIPIVPSISQPVQVASAPKFSSSALDRPIHPSEIPVRGEIGFDARDLGRRSLKTLQHHAAKIAINAFVLAVVAFGLIKFMLVECFGAMYSPCEQMVLLIIVLSVLLLMPAAYLMGLQRKRELDETGSVSLFSQCIEPLLTLLRGTPRMLALLLVEFSIIGGVLVLFGSFYSHDMKWTRYATRCTAFGFAWASKPQDNVERELQLRDLMADMENNGTAPERVCAMILAGQAYEEGYFQYNRKTASPDKMEAEFRKAVTASSSIAKEHPGIAAASWFGLGQALALQNKYSEADMAFRKALAIFDANKTDVLAINEIKLFAPWFNLSPMSPVKRPNVKDALARLESQWKDHRDERPVDAKYELYE